MPRCAAFYFLMKSLFAACCFLCFPALVQAQITGGQFAMEYLRLPNAPHVSALGSIAVANPTTDISFALQNPALARPALHNQLGLNYNSYYAGINILNLNYGYYIPKLETSFALGIQYLNYGSFTQTDIYGNENGTFKAADYAVTLAASRAYGERWRYGAALKYAHSNLGAVGATALLADVGVVYYDTTNFITVGAVAKNMGFMTTKYVAGNPAEPLPFDLQIGISKRFKHLPLRLMATVHHLYEWDIRYNNPNDIDRSNLFGSTAPPAEKSYFADKLFRHFIFAAEVTLGSRLGVIVAYNHLRRGELGLADKTALAGFSFGGSLYLNKFQVHYARSYYHLAGAYNEIGLNFTLNKLFNIGQAGDRIHWNADYADWKME